MLAKHKVIPEHYLHAEYKGSEANTSVKRYLIGYTPPTDRTHFYLVMRSKYGQIHCLQPLTSPVGPPEGTQLSSVANRCEYYEDIMTKHPLFIYAPDSTEGRSTPKPVTHVDQQKMELWIGPRRPWWREAGMAPVIKRDRGFTATQVTTTGLVHLLTLGTAPEPASAGQTVRIASPRASSLPQRPAETAFRWVEPIAGSGRFALVYPFQIGDVTHCECSVVARSQPGAPTA